MNPWRLPLGPLLHYAQPWGPAQHEHRGHAELAQLIGVSRRTVTRWAAEGVPIVSADRAAMALGLHPTEVWGRMFYWAAAA